MTDTEKEQVMQVTVALRGVQIGDRFICKLKPDDMQYGTFNDCVGAVIGPIDADGYYGVEVMVRGKIRDARAKPTCMKFLPDEE